MTEKLPFDAFYLMNAVFSQGKRISAFEPTPNAFILAEPIEGEASDKNKSRLLATNSKGQLTSVKQNGSKDLELSSLTHHLHVQLTFLPPADAVDLLAASEGKEWAKKLIEISKSIQATKIPLKLTDIPIEDVRKPAKTSNPSKAELDYDTWYSSLPKSKPVKGYILAKTKAIVIVVRDNLLINFDQQLTIFPPLGKDIKATWRQDISTGYRVAIVTGDDTPLKEGLYKIRLPLISDAKEDPKWHKLISEQDGEPYYSLAEMVRFDIKTPAGDLDIICGDPISLEETLLTQYGRFYSHRLEQATKLSADNATMGTAAQDAAKGISDYAKSLDVWKNKSQLAAGLIQHDLNNVDGRKDLRKAIAKALHEHIATDPAVKATLDSVFAIENGLSAWQDLLDAREKALKATSGSTKAALLNKYIRLKPATVEDMQAFQGSLAHKAGIPMKGLRYFGRTMQTLDLASNVHALSKGGVALFKDTLPNAQKAVKDFNTVAEDYFFHLSKHEVQPVLTLTNQFELDSAELSKETLSQLTDIAPKLIKNVAEDPNRRITVTGHTCDLGGYEYNLGLSQARADAIAEQLVELGVPQKHINAVGLGEEQPLPDAPNSNNEERARNRRVEIVDFSIGTSGVYPSREGIGNLERFRNLSVQGKLKVIDDALAVTNKAIDIALGVMSVIPATAPVAAAVGVAKAGSKALVSLCALADQTFCNNYFKQLANEANLNQKFTRESSANQSLLEQLGRKALANNNAQNADLWAAQFRVRAEAIAGLVRLIIRAEIGADDHEDYIARIKKYQLEAYISNFIMGDDWLYPLGNFQTVRMDSYWLYAINGFNRTKDEKKFNNGLDKDNRLLSADELERIKKSAIERVKQGETDLPPGYAPQGSYMMMPAKGLHVPKHLTTQYQHYFPIHYRSNDAETLAKTFGITHSQYSTGDYLFSSIKYKDGDAWKAFVTDREYQDIERARDAYKAKLLTGSSGYMATYTPMPSIADIKTHRITPNTAVRVLIVFERTTDVLPLTFTIERNDGLNVTGPSYKELATPLNEDDLLPDEKQFAGKIGCIFYPFFQVWDKNILGLKPIASEYTLTLMSAGVYYLLGNLDNMEYQIKCRIGSNVSTEQVIPLLSKPGIGGGFARDCVETIHVDINEKRSGEQAYIDKDFLVSRTSSFDYPKLFDGDKSVRTLIRLGNAETYIAPGTFKTRDGRYIPIFEDEAKHFSCTKFDISTSGTKVTIDNFDWESAVEFTTIVAASEINTKPYLKENAKSPVDFASAASDWRNIPCDLTLHEETFFSKTAGPTYSSSLIYLGKATITTQKLPMLNGIKIQRKLSFDNAHTDKVKTEKYSSIVELLKNNNIKALELLDLQDYKNSEPTVRHIFASTVECSYESPKARKVTSLRPFSKDIYNDKYMEVSLSLSTAGQSGFKDLEIEKNSHNYTYEFSLPENMRSGVPWARPMHQKELDAIKPKLRDHTHIFEALSRNNLTKEELMEWLQDSKSLKYNYTSAFKSMI